MEEISLENGRGLILVAHPDDETIWVGGVLLRFKNVLWTVFSLCRRDDPDRRPKFLRVMDFYGVQALISDLDDEDRLSPEESIAGIKERICCELPVTDFDYIFTHGLEGEYGHPRHKETALAVKKMLAENELVGHHVFSFAYKLDLEKNFCLPYLSADFCLELSEEEFRIKQKIITALYGFNKKSFECQSCAKIETFNRLFLK